MHDQVESGHLPNPGHFIRQVTEMVPDMISVTELPSRRLIYCNNESFILNGYDREALMRMSLEERNALIHPDDLPLLHRYYESFTPGTGDEEIHTLHYRAKNKTGSFLTFFVRGKVFERNDDGSVRSILNIVQNITEQTRHKAELKDQAQLIRGITDIMPDIVTIVELPSGNILYANRDTMAWPGFDEEETRMSFADRTGLFHPDDLPAIHAFYERFSALEDREENTVEYRLKNKTGDWITLSLRGQVFRRDLKGNATQALLMAQDITERKKAGEQLRQNSELLEIVLNNTASSIMLLKPVRNKQRTIVDFEYLFTNQQTLSSVNRETLTGKYLTREFPGIKGSLLLQAYIQVMETGTSYQSEVDFTPFGQPVWAQVYARKTGEHLLVTYFDVTERKQGEQETHASKGRLEAIFNIVPIALAKMKAIRENGNVIDFGCEWLNEEAIKLYGSPAGNGMPASLPGIRASGLFDLMLRTLETGQPAEAEICCNAGGYEQLLYCKMVRLNDGVMLSCEEITQRRNAEKELLHLKDELARKATDRYLTLFNNMKQGFCIVEMLFDDEGNAADYRFLETNPVFEKQTGLYDVVGKSMKELQPAHEEYWFRTYGDVVKSGRSIHFEGEAAHLSGGVWYEVFALPFNKPGTNQVAIFFNDITARKKAIQAAQDFNVKLEREVEERTIQLKQTINQLESFNYIASHDLQEPLRKVRTFAELLKESEPGDPAMNAYINGIYDSSLRMSQLIESLLSYSRNTRVSESFKQVDLNRIVHEVKGDYEIMIMEKRARIKSRNLPAIKAIPFQMTQLFSNLVSNSLKFSDKPPVITIQSRTITGKEIPIGLPEKLFEKWFVELIFTDNGIGFDNRYREKIFQLFQRLDTSSTYSGTGIGLSIVYRIVQQHNGYIRAEGEPGKGAAFRVYLPVC